MPGNPSNVILHVPARTRQSLWFAECLFTILVTGEESGGSYTTMELLIPPGKGPNLHQHEAEEEQEGPACEQRKAMRARMQLAKLLQIIETKPADTRNLRHPSRVR